MSKVLTIVDIIKDSTSNDRYFVDATNSYGEKVKIDLTDIVLELSHIILECKEDN